MSHVFTRDIPDRQQNAMSFMITRPVLMRLAKVSKRDWAIGCSNDFGKQNLFWGTGQNVATTNASFGFHKPSALEYEQNLF
jgi:hypothetical protein